MSLGLTWVNVARAEPAPLDPHIRCSPLNTTPVAAVVDTPATAVAPVAVTVNAVAGAAPDVSCGAASFASDAASQKQLL